MPKKSAYTLRDEALETMGYYCYQDYLESSDWKRIRKQVLKDATCVGCGNSPTQVHHEKYTLQNLAGTTLDGMKPICRSCHEHIEFGNRKAKVSLKQANFRLNKLIRTRKKLIEKTTCAPVQAVKNNPPRQYKKKRKEINNDTYRWNHKYPVQTEEAKRKPKQSQLPTAHETKLCQVCGQKIPACITNNTCIKCREQLNTRNDKKAKAVTLNSPPLRASLRKGKQSRQEPVGL